MTIIAKILKCEMILLFILAVCSTLSFFVGPLLPDNYFSISSSASANWFFYYLTTLLEFVAHLSGAWSSVAFFSFLGLYVFSFAKRNKLVDVFTPIPMMVFELIFFYWCFPQSVGMGPSFVFETIFSFWYQVLFFVLSLVGFSWCLLKGMDRFSFNLRKFNPSLLKLPSPPHFFF